jgi:hypothetical protein
MLRYRAEYDADGGRVVAIHGVHPNTTRNVRPGSNYYVQMVRGGWRDEICIYDPPCPPPYDECPFTPPCSPDGADCDPRCDWVYVPERDDATSCGEGAQAEVPPVRGRYVMEPYTRPGQESAVYLNFSGCSFSIDFPHTGVFFGRLGANGNAREMWFPQRYAALMSTIGSPGDFRTLVPPPGAVWSEGEVRLTFGDLDLDFVRLNLQ